MIEVAKIANPGTNILQEVVRLLEKVDLPTCDIGSMDLFAHFGELRRIVGVGGVQFFDSDKVLRSVAVAPGHQGGGIGTAIVKHILATPAVAAGNIYLFTSTAEEFFRKFGFETIPWPDVPQAIVASPLVSRHCKFEAVPMMISL